MAQNPTTNAGIRLQSEFDAITDEVSRRTQKWITDLRRTDKSQARLDAILMGLAFAILDHLPEDSMPEEWGALLGEYLEATADDNELGQPAQSQAGEDAEEPDKCSQESAPQSDLLDQGSEPSVSHHQAGKFPRGGGMGSQGATAAGHGSRRNKPGAA